MSEKLDETIRGGKYMVSGQLVNANGEFIDDAGNLIGGRLPKRPAIKGRVIRDFYQVGGYKKIPRLENGIKVVDEIPFTIKKDWITNESFTEKANEIFKKVNKKFQKKFANAKDENELEKIEAEQDSEYMRRLNKWFYPEKNTHGRPEGSPNKNSTINQTILKQHIRKLFKADDKVNQKFVANKLNVSERTLRDYVKGRFNLKWKSFCEKVICGDI